jgi:hypothetical protein
MVPLSQNVLPNGMGGYSSFRGGAVFHIPNSTRTLISACARTVGGDAGCRGIILRTSDDGGQTWANPSIVANASSEVWSGAIPDGVYSQGFVHELSTATTFLFWAECLEKCRPGRNQTVWRAPSYMLISSTDGFETWSTRNLTAEAGGDAANSLFPDNYYGNGLQLVDGSLLMCGSQMLFDNPPAGHAPGFTDGGFCVRSVDRGLTWQRGSTFASRLPPCTATGCVKMQMQVGRFSNGTLLAMGAGGKGEAFANSFDGGLTFSPVRIDARLPTVTQSDLLVQDNLIVVSHDHDHNTSVHDLNRRNLTLSSSHDLGVTWRHLPILPEHGDADFSGSSTMSHMPRCPQPAAATTGGAVQGQGCVAVAYERGKMRFDGDGIWFVAIPYILL